MRVGVAVTQIPFLRDDGQGRAQELVQALRRAGHEAEVVWVPFNGRLEYRLAEQMLACQLLDLEGSMGTKIDRLIGLTFPAYLVPHSAKVIWLLRRCRPAYDLWATPYANLHTASTGEQLRRLIRNADVHLIPRARNVFVPSCSAAEQLHADCGIVATPLQAPPSYAEHYRHSGDGDFFLLPAPTDSPLRKELVLQAMRQTRHPVRLRVLAGHTDWSTVDLDEPADLSSQGRIIHVEAVGDERRALFGNCLAVICASVGEADGVVALEAMLSEKAMVTCDDAGGVVDFVHDGETGFVCPSCPEALAELLDLLWEDRSLGRRLGRTARANYLDLRLSWDGVVESLLS
jgi:glycosyltransferase involved in cell wall biosynthesis